MVLGKHSGRHAFRKRLEELGYELAENELATVFSRFKELADKKKNIYNEDIHALVMGVAHAMTERYKLLEVSIASGTHKTPQATVKLEGDGEVRSGTGEGDGPVDALFKVIQQLTGFRGTLKKFSINAVTGGADAQGEVMVAVEQDGFEVRGIGSHTDIVVAAALAYLNALNRLEATGKYRRAPMGKV